MNQDGYDYSVDYDAYEDLPSFYDEDGSPSQEYWDLAEREDAGYDTIRTESGYYPS